MLPNLNSKLLREARVELLRLLRLITRPPCVLRPLCPAAGRGLPPLRRLPATVKGVANARIEIDARAVLPQLPVLLAVE